MASTSYPAKSTSPSKGRQKTVKDPLDEAGFVSKGDTKLLDPKAQELYYNNIVERYMRFCSDYSSDIDTAFASLPKHRSEDPTKNPPVPVSRSVPVRGKAAGAPQSHGQARTAVPRNGIKDGKVAQPQNFTDSAAKDLSVLLLSLRKLREGVIATAEKTPVAFAQQVHIFCIRTGILARHPPSYYPPLKRLLTVLHTPSNPLSDSDLHEFTTYIVLDYACRQNDFSAAIGFRKRAFCESEFSNRICDGVISALIHDSWVSFWKARKGAEGYTRSLMDWAVSFVRKRALKSIAKSYLSVEPAYIIQCCTGKEDGCTWEQLVEEEGLGWKIEGNKVIIKVRKPVPKT